MQTLKKPTVLRGGRYQSYKVVGRYGASNNLPDAYLIEIRPMRQEQTLCKKRSTHRKHRTRVH